MFPLCCVPKTQTLCIILSLHSLNIKMILSNLSSSVSSSSQGLNPGKAIAEIKKMMATYKEKKAAAV